MSYLDILGLPNIEDETEIPLSWRKDWKDLLMLFVHVYEEGGFINVQILNPALKRKWRLLLQKKKNKDKDRIPNQFQISMMTEHIS